MLWRLCFNLTAFLSLCLGVVTAALWERSYRERGQFMLRHENEGSQLIRAADGVLLVRHIRADPQRPKQWGRKPMEYGFAPLFRPMPLGGQVPAVAAESVHGFGPVQLDFANDANLASNRVATYDWISKQQIRMDAIAVGARLARADRAAGKISCWFGLSPFDYERATEWIATEGEDLAEANLARWQFTTPLWLVVSLLALMPIAWFAKCVAQIVHWARVRRRRQTGQCVGCGYDMAATPVQCPECGKLSWRLAT